MRNIRKMQRTCHSCSSLFHSLSASDITSIQVLMTLGFQELATALMLVHTGVEVCMLRRQCWWID